MYYLGGKKLENATDGLAWVYIQQTFHLLYYVGRWNVVVMAGARVVILNCEVTVGKEAIPGSTIK